MSSGNSEDQGFSLSVPVGAAAAAVLLTGAAALAYVLIGRGDEPFAPSTSEVAKSGRSLFRRWGIMGLVTLIENDATRKVVVAILKAMARRA